MSIEGVFIATQSSEPMQSLENGILIAGRGIDGDRYSNYTGTYSVLRVSKHIPGEREPGRQLTMISADSVEEAFERHGLKTPVDFRIGDLRRNLVLRGVTSQELLNAIGRIVRLGPVCLVRIIRHCVPCLYNERKNKIPCLMEGIWDEAGVSCEVLVGGSIAVGDKVVIQEDSTSLVDGDGKLDPFSNTAVDDGNQPPGYYVRPSKRTRPMNTGATKYLREKKQELIVTDPEGVARAEAAYNSVHLNFWPSEE